MEAHYARINSDGTLGSWFTSTTPLPDFMYASGSVVYKNNIYLIGGVTLTTGVTNKVYRTVVNPSNGSISSFEEVTSLPHSFNSSNQAIIVGTKIFVVGGGDSFGPLNTVYFTDVNPNGTLQPWQLSSHTLPKPIAGGAVAFLKGYLYILGGYSGGYLNDVYASKLDINLETVLDVLLLKQTNSAWGQQIYDTANKWSPGNATINRWGCALTSAAMVFNYHKITKLPDGTALNPGTLNTWLKNQNDGFVNNGWINWLALTRLSKQAKTKNPNFAYDALEYRRYGYSASQLTADLENNIPGILEEPGHFIVGKATQGNSFEINDPFFDRTSLSSYGNTALSLGRFIPSNTDLSYMMFVIEDSMDLKVKDSSGGVVGEGFTQQPIDEDGGNKKNGPQFYQYYVPAPSANTYVIEVSGVAQKPYTLQIFLYDEKGNVKKQGSNGVAGGANKDVYKVIFSKQNSNSSTATEQVSFDNLIADLDYFYSVKKIKNYGVYLALKEKVIQARYFYTVNKKTSQAMMKSFITQLDSNKNSTVQNDAYNILKPQISFLLNLLN